MRFRHRDDVLPGAVASAVGYESTGLEPGEHRGLPSPWVTFIVSAGEPVRICGTVAEGDGFDSRLASSYDVVVAGLHPVAARVERPSTQSGVQLALHPLALRGLLGCRASELVGPGSHGEEVLGPLARELHDRVSAAASVDARLDVVQRWVRGRGDELDRTAVRPELSRVWHLAERSGGRCRVEDLAREVALSPRRLRALMMEEVGLSPKQLCRAFRFDGVVRHLAAGQTHLAEVAAATGYADQAHLSREFRDMVGCTPTEWLVEEGRNLQDGGHRNRPDWAHE